MSRQLLVGLIAALSVVVCLVLIRHDRPTELMYGEGNNWGGFLATNGEEGLSNHRTPNSLSKQDLALLKVAAGEERDETKEDSASKKHDLAALRARDAREAKLKAEQKEMHEQQLASVPTPFKKQHANKPGRLSHSDRTLLKVAENEMVAETRKAQMSKKEDMKAEALREKQLAAKAKAKAKAAKAHAVHLASAKHAAHKLAVSSHVDHRWGGFLPSLNGDNSKVLLNAKALRLLQSAKKDQQQDYQRGMQARKRDTLAFKKMNHGMTQLDSARVHHEARQEFQHIEHHSMVGLEHATMEDDDDERRAWGHMSS